MHFQLARPSDESKPLHVLAAAIAILLAALAWLHPAPRQAGQASTTHLSDFLAGEARQVQAVLLKNTPRPEESPAELRQLARQAMQEKDYARARTLYRSAIAADPDSFSAWMGLSLAAERVKPENWSQRTALQREARAARAMPSHSPMTPAPGQGRWPGSAPPSP